MRRTIALDLLAGIVAACVGAAAAHGATFTVTKLDDTADGGCDADCSLREAVIAANAAAGADTIVLPAGTYDLAIADAAPGTDEDQAATGDLDVAGGGLTIEGAGAALTEIDADAIGNRVFHVRRDFSSSAVTLRGMRLERGDTSGFSSSGGAAIRIDDSFPGLVVALEDVAIERCSGGSAVRTVATLRTLDVTFAENATTTALELATIGQNKTGTAATRVERTTFRENDGFAITAVKSENRSHAFEVVNSTFYANNAIGASGTDAAIFTTNSAKIWNSTISDDGRYGLAAITDFYGTPTVEVQSTVFAGNAAGSVMPLGATDGAVLPVSRGGNVVSDAGAGAFSLPTDHTSTNALLLPIADNGGKTPTRALDPASPAIDAGLNAGPLASCPAVDQRGEARPQDGDGDGEAICDAGAVEAPEPGSLVIGVGALAAVTAVSRRGRRFERQPESRASAIAGNT